MQRPLNMLQRWMRVMQRPLQSTPAAPHHTVSRRTPCLCAVMSFDPVLHVLACDAAAAAYAAAVPACDAAAAQQQTNPCGP
jgi:hypothetical protein